ncbi:hypothetical protein OSTOST_19519, partial [Ostertagia ostertagi]
MIRDKESPPKGLVQKRREQFTNAATAEEYRPLSSRSDAAQDERCKLIGSVMIFEHRQTFFDGIPDDPIGDECCETTTTTERLSRRQSECPSCPATLRGFPVVTVSVADPSSRRRSLGELHQPAVVHVRDSDTVGPTVIPVTRSSPTTCNRPVSPSKKKSSRPNSRHAVQVELFDSTSLTIPPPTDRFPL